VEKPDPMSAVILCSHVFEGTHPILRAVRDEPTDERDSGWQVLCNVHEHHDDDGKLCSVSNLIKLEPTLEDFVNVTHEVTLVRHDEHSDWAMANEAN
jgi:hypothetical protein